MQVRELLHTLFSNTLEFMHAKRAFALLDAVQGLLLGKKLSLTHLARHLTSPTKERNCIRKMDRLLGNRKLHSEIKSCYHAHCILLLGKIANPVISIDWAATDKRQNWHILRATLTVDKRGYALYQEVHPRKKSNSRHVQHEFLNKLKSILPENCKPIIITDAGFRFPWFGKVKQIGFNFVGRVRQKTKYRTARDKKWNDNCLSLYEKATRRPAFLGKLFFTKQDHECNVVLYKKTIKGKKHINRSGNLTNNNASNRCARRERDPWLLVTSLEITRSFNPERIAALYALRMQIEEDFRDIKSHRYGFSLRYSLSNNIKRLEVLLLIAALACFVCWLVSLSAKRKNLHLDYQSNSIKHRNVLSVIYLGCQLIRRNEEFSLAELKEAYQVIQSLALKAFLC